jgi:hypothetical protein
MSEKIMTLSVSFGRRWQTTPAVAARIGDFYGVLAGLHYVGDLLGAQLRDHLRDNSSSNGSAALSAATNSRAFLPYADSLRLRRSSLHETTSERIRRGHHRAVDTPPSTSRRFFPAEIVSPPVASLPEPGDHRRRLAG